MFNAFKKISLFTTAFLIGFFNCFSQRVPREMEREFELDSLKILIMSDPSKAIPMIEKLKKSDNSCLQFNGQYYDGYLATIKGTYQDAIFTLEPLLVYVKNSEKLFTKECYKRLIFKMVNTLFFAEKNLGHYHKALRLLEENHPFLDPDVLLFLYGTAHMGLGNYVEAIRLFKKDIEEGYVAKRIQKTPHKNNFGMIMAQRLNALGDAYQKLYVSEKKESSLDSADLYYSKAAEVIRPTDKFPDYTNALLISRKAKSYALKGDYQAALYLYKKVAGVPLIIEKKTEHQLIDLCMADCFFNMGQLDSAVFYGSRFLNTYAISPTNNENLLTAYFILTVSYEKQNNTEKAYLFAKKRIDLIEEIKKSQKQAMDFIHNYNIKMIQGQYLSLVNEKSKVVDILVFLGLQLLILFMCLYFYNRQNNQKKYQRFLAILNSLPSNTSLYDSENLLVKEVEIAAFNDATQTDKNTKPLIDEASIIRISEGLKKLEKQHLYLRADYKLAYVAKKLQTNTVYLSHYFNHIRKQPFSNYVQELRIQYVLRELKENAQFRRYSLQAIAEEIGYKNANTFVSVFKKTTGISPNFYIRELNKNNSQETENQ